MQSVDKIDHLSRRQFRCDYLRQNRPVVVTDALESWSGMTIWDVGFFRSRIGREMVHPQGYNFDRLSSDQIPFTDFLDTFVAYDTLTADAPQFLEAVPYVRAQCWTPSQQKVLHGILEDGWANPYFLPKSLYLFPFDVLSCEPNRRKYPLFGCYFSPRGAETGLHMDPWNSSAILCQVSGTKRGFLLPPDTKEQWRDNNLASAEKVTARKIEVLQGQTPNYEGLPMWQFELKPGEALYIPMGWAHEVFTACSSISLTYNFIHLLGIGLKWFTVPGSRQLIKRQLVNRFGITTRR